jgi:hypothetical protein
VATSATSGLYQQATPTVPHDATAYTYKDRAGWPGYDLRWTLPGRLTRPEAVVGVFTRL